MNGAAAHAEVANPSSWLHCFDIRRVRSQFWALGGSFPVVNSQSGSSRPMYSDASSEGSPEPILFHVLCYRVSNGLAP